MNGPSLVLAWFPQQEIGSSKTDLSKTSSIDWLQLVSLAEVKIVFIDGAPRQAYTVFIVVVVLKPGDR